MVLKTVLVALDSSELSERVVTMLPTLINLQSTTKIIFSHVLPSFGSANEQDAERPHKSPREQYREIEETFHLYQSQLSCQSELEIVSGDPAEEIIRLANIYHVELIVIGTRGLKGVERIIEGSVSSQVVADAPCSVLTIKP